MKKERVKTPDLTDIAFEGRNQEYGAFLLRKKYMRYLLFSMFAGTIIFLLFIFIPWAIYYFGSDDTLYNESGLYSVDYTFIPPPEDMPLIVPPSASAPPPVEKTTVPVVVDSVTEEKQKTEENEQPVEEPGKDTSSSQGNSQGTEGVGNENGPIYTALDVYPHFPGGDQARLLFLRANVRYPDVAMKNVIQGVVKILFVVEPDGTLSRFEISKSIGGGCDEEALRVAKLMPRWEPGRRNGRTVRVLISMPIVFRLPYKPK